MIASLPKKKELVEVDISLEDSLYILEQGLRDKFRLPRNRWTNGDRLMEIEFSRRESEKDIGAATPEQILLEATLKTLKGLVNK